MAIIKGSKILASDWNNYIRSLDSETVFSKSIPDILFQDNSDSGTKNFWVRYSGWDWGNIYNSSYISPPFSVGEMFTVEDGGYKVQLKANKDTSNVPAFGDTDWDLVKYEFGFKSVVTNDLVVFGGGIFKAKTNAGTTKPVIPKYGKLSYSDSNYSLTLPTNCSVDFTTILVGGVYYVTISLVRPGYSSIVVYDGETSLNGGHTDLWLSPGYYKIDWEFQDTADIGLKNADCIIKSKIHDDNIEQFDKIKIFKSDLSDFAAPYATKIIASTRKNSKDMTGSSLIKKGGTETSYTGDW